MTEEERTIDIITEVINIGVGDAASALSSLVNRRIRITVPEVRILDTFDIAAFVEEIIPSLGVYVSQDFRGRIKGKTLLVYTRESSCALLSALTGQSPAGLALSQTEMATLQELGNILMVSCVSTISDMIQDGVRFEVPQVAEEISDTYFFSLVEEFSAYDKTIVVKNQIAVQDTDITSYLFVLLGVADLRLVVDMVSEKLRP